MRRREAYWQTPLGRWVDAFGVAHLVHELHMAGQPIHQMTVYKWISGEQIPRPILALELVRISAQSISLQQIYEQRDLIALAERQEREAARAD